ncbi:MAG: TonB-dependent receptor plug domain-containing protein [Candidatus Krumholzibacteriota bacterium]|nr:TonB-dependent receptor plug domain-containing protein [Candidatus Krumholzibacteriota bacterium]
MAARRLPGFLAALFLASSALAEPFVLEGQALRLRHADTLEDLLRTLPLLRVERVGAAGLPWHAMPAAAAPEDFLLVVDGLPWRDAWTGANLAEELPLALIARVVVDLAPAQAAYGADARAGVIRVTTRRHEAPRVETRIHLSRGPWSERARRLSFETPPGPVRVAVGLDEFRGEGYAFSAVQGTSGLFPDTRPEVALSRRRVLCLRADVAGGAAGPVELQLVQSTWHLDLGEPAGTPLYRDGYQVSLALPTSPLGALRIAQRFLESRSRAWTGTDAGLSARWDAPRWRLGRAGLDLRAGAERHQLGLAVAAAPDLPRPSRLWASASATGDLPAGFDLAAGLRAEREIDHADYLLWEATLDWPRETAPFRLGFFAAGGEGAEPWQRDRVPGLSRWPFGPTTPSAPPGAAPLRAGLRLRLRSRYAWADLELVESRDRRDWALVDDGAGGLAWQGAVAPERQAAGLAVGGELDGPLGRVESALSLQGEFGDEVDEPVTGRGYPLAGRWRLDLSRSLFGGDAALRLGGTLSCRAGLAGRDPLWRVDLSVEYRVLDACFWLLVENALDAAGEEVVGYPVPPLSLRLGLDWHLRH